MFVKDEGDFFVKVRNRANRSEISNLSAEFSFMNFRLIFYSLPNELEYLFTLW